MVFVTCPPFNLASVLHSDRRTAQQLLDHAHAICAAILKAESGVYGRTLELSKAVKNEVALRLRDVSFNSFQLVREVWMVCEGGNWRADDTEINHVANILFGGQCETKYSLEDLFAHLSTVQRQLHQTQPMNKLLDIV